MECMLETPTPMRYALSWRIKQHPCPPARKCHCTERDRSDVFCLTAEGEGDFATGELGQGPRRKWNQACEALGLGL
jgi:hypothetical protein